jgi:hypothetical protein
VEIELNGNLQEKTPVLGMVHAVGLIKATGE